MDQDFHGKTAFTAPRWSRRRVLQGALAASAAVSPPVRGRAAAEDTILVVGAGLAGLVTAYRLREAGKRVTLIEARPVPGGRVRTLRNTFDDGLYGELGPNRISDTHAYVLHWVNEFNLPLVPFAPENASQILVLDRKSVV